MRVILIIGKVLGAVLVAIALFIGMAIPAAKITEEKVANPGKKVEKVVFRNANIIPMDSNYVLRDYALFIENDKIVKLSIDSLAEFDGYEVIDLRGKYIAPGLIDMHTHVFDRSDLTNYLAYGVTHVRNMMGFPMHVRWKAQWNNGEFPGSEMITASPTLNAGEGTDPFHNTLKKDDDLDEILNQYKRDGYDFFKVYDGLSGEQFSEIMRHAEKLNMKVAGHPPVSVPRTELINSGLVSVEHIEEIYNTYLNRNKNDSLASVIANEFALAKKPICITLSAYHNIYLASNHKGKFLKEVPLDQINPLLIFIGNRLLSDYLNPPDKLRIAIDAKHTYLTKLTKMFYEAEVPLIFGTDTGPNLTVPGYTVHQELQLLENAGIPRYPILRSATIDALQLMGKDLNEGGIVEGGIAQFIIVSKNPLEDLTTLKHPTTIVHHGVQYDSSAIENLLLLGKRKTGKYATMGNLLQQVFNK